MTNNENKGRERGLRKRKKFLLILLSFLVFLFVGFFLLIQTPVFINLLGSVLGAKFGYKISAQNFSFSSGLEGEISNLEITRLKDGVLSFISPHVDFKGKIRMPLKGEVEKITLTQPKLIFRYEKKKKLDLSFIKKLPPVYLLTIQKGEFELSFASSPQVIKLSEIDLQIKDFSPQKGGIINFQSTLRILSNNGEGMEGFGRVKGYLNLVSLFPRPSGRGFVEFHIDSGSYHSASFQNLILRIPVNIEKEKVVIDLASLDLDHLTYKMDHKNTTLRDLRFQTSFLYDLKSDEIKSRIIEGKVSNLGIVKGSFGGTLRGVLPWKASIDATSVDFAEIFSIVKPFLSQEYQKWFIRGKGDMEAHLEGNYLEQRLSWTGDVILQLRQGEFSSSDGTKAGQGITGKVILKIQSSPSDKSVTPVRKIGLTPLEKFSNGVSLELSSELGNGEFLYGKFYKDFSGERIKLFAQGNFFLDSPRLLEFQGTVDLFGTGDYSFSGLIQKDESFFNLKAEKISHKKILSLFRDYLSQNFFSLKDLQLKGDSDINIKAVIKVKAVTVEGTLEVKNASLRVPGMSFYIDQIDLMLPFDLFYPSTSDLSIKEGGKRKGFLKIKVLEKDKIRLENLTIPLILSRNTLQVSEDIKISLLGGKMKVTGFKGDDILSASRLFNFGLEAEEMDLKLLSQNLAGMDFPGILNAYFPTIKYQEGILSAQGKAVVKIFGGEVEAMNLSVRNLFSRSQKITGDLNFKGIDLEKVTEKIKIGKMTGVIQGSIKNLEIEYGQPSRFVLDVESVKTRGVKQRISVDAVQNISILGTGSGGITKILSSGIRRFFKEYPYSQIGIICTLENDKFSVRGKIHEGGTEYLVRRAFLRGINVVNQNPQNVISFKDMQERVKRIFQAK